MKFRSLTSKPQKFISPSGSRLRKKYIKEFQVDGTSRLIESGVEDVYDSIQKAAKGNLLEDLINRARAGDATAIREPIESYADISGMPTDLLEAHAMLLDARAKYYALPPSVRAKFNNSFDEFLRSTQNIGDFVKKLSPDAVDAVDSDAVDAVDSDVIVQPLSSEEIAKIRSTLGGTKDA